MKRFFENKKRATVIILIVAIAILTVTNYTKVFLGSNAITRALYWNSENLVYNEMVMSYQPGSKLSYGLSDMYPYNGTYNGGYSNEELDFDNGYCTTDKIIAVSDNDITQREYAAGNTIIFFSGDKAEVVGNYASDGILFVQYEADRIYSIEEQGELKYITIYNNDENRYMQIGDRVGYESQIGVQGILFRAFPKGFLVNDMIAIYRVVLALLFATIITMICFFLYKKYHLLFGIIFYIVSLLAPWMTGYSTNLYWVEFTWFLPMLIGIICAYYIDSRKIRIISYVGVMLAIALKSACGYEYLSTIMLSSIIFLLADFTIALIEHKDKKKMLQLFKTIFCMGIFALLGFIIVLVIHAYIRGDGSIYHGLRSIYYNDVLRRTLGGDPSMFQDVYADSLNASVIYVVLRYLKFDTALIAGVPGMAFIPLIMLSFILTVMNVVKKTFRKEILALYIWMGIASVSWFVLGKSHSYIHTSMNFVMWYFGYIQIIFYTIIAGIYQLVKNRKNAVTEKEVV